MAENEAEKTYTDEEKAAMWSALPETVTEQVTSINGGITTHNKDIALIKAASGEESKKLLFEFRDQNPDNDEQLATSLKEIDKLRERTEKLIAAANERAAIVYADQLKMPTPEEVEAARERVSKSGTELRALAKATAVLEKFLGVPVHIFLKEIGSLKGTGAKSSSSSGDVWRPRTSAIYVNGELVQQEVQTKNGKEAKSTLNITAAYLNKQVNEKAFSTVDLQQAYLKAAGGDRDNIPESVEFDLPFTKGETTLNFHVKVERSGE